MKHSNIPQETWRHWLGVPNASNIRAVCNDLIRLAPQIVQDLGVEITPAFPSQLVRLQTAVADNGSSNTQVKYWTNDEGTLCNDNGAPHRDRIMDEAKLVNQFCAPSGDCDKGHSRQYEYSHPLVVIAVNMFNNILNMERGHYILRDNSRAWSLAYITARLHAGLIVATEHRAGVEIVMGPAGYTHSHTRGSLDFYGQEMLRGWAGHHMDLVMIDRDDEQQTVTIKGKYQGKVYT